ncbi:hypothetical protein Igag_0599 [Ignisphaera aggregans DSM 17230]|uniref:Uncharacterized protein n=1 Tax=Ignisphaera aggregans (strain DSM 17230 / JCM 13409 / AQ1.S1) TaxID=583356 RepID=E0SSG1_IGNAA|nr:hypothetical protein Igag_0599 [Ignisphaera aggregans DSM 17230]
MNTRTIGVIVAIIAVATIVTTVVYTVYALNTKSNIMNTPLQQSLAIPSNITMPCRFNKSFEMMWSVKWGMPWRGGVKHGLLMGGVEISDEFRDRIVSILNSNENTSKLLSEGYNVSRIMPIGMKMIVNGDGTVTLRVARVVVELAKDSSKVFVWIDVESGSILRIASINIWESTATSTTTVSQSLTV